MDLGIAGKKAIVCSVDTALGLACAQALASEGAYVFATAKDPDQLQSAMGEMPADSAGATQSVVCDVTTVEGRQTLLAACPEPDILVNHAPGPPAGDFRSWTRADWERAIEANMLSGIAMISEVYDGMVQRGFGRIVNITSQAVRAPMAELDLSNAARAGLTGFVAGVARQKRDADVTINNLLPGTFVTKPLANYIANKAAKEGVSEAEFSQRLLGANPLMRLGQPEEFGATCAFVCSTLAGYLNGQNILLDGGNFPGVV